MLDNPLENELRTIETALQDLSESQNRLDRELSWYQNTNFLTLTNVARALESRQRRIEACQQRLNLQINGIQSEIKQLPIKSLLNPAGWISVEQKKLRRRRKTLIQTEKELRQQLQATDILSDITCNELRSNTDKLQRYNTFEKKKCDANIEEYSVRIREKKEEMNRIKRRKEKLDKALQPFISQFDECKKVIDELGPAEATLQAYQLRLRQAADDPSARWAIHSECEAKFGTGSPSELIRKLRDMQKIKARIDETIRTFSSDIRKIIIDGNNLCYAHEQFVGLDILNVLIPVLLQEYAITIIFDPGFEFIIKRTKEQIVKKYKPATVHFTPKGHKADALIVQAASADKHTWILSGDRFAEYTDYSVIREQRLIQPVIDENRIHILNLNINLEFRPIPAN